MPRLPGHGPAYEGRRQEIIDQAARLFAVRGYAATGILALCEEVGLGKGALYYYIGSKEELLVEIQDRVLAPLLGAAARIKQLDAPAIVRIRLLSQQLMDGILGRLDHVWVYEHDFRQLTGENRVRFRERRLEFENVVQAHLREANDAGDIKLGDMRLSTLQFLNLHNHTYQWARHSTAWTGEELSATYFRTLMLGFGADQLTVDRAEASAKAILGRD